MGKAYESLAIFPTSMKDEELDKALSELVHEIERHSGRVIGVEKMGAHSFARPMKKLEAGYYVKIGFEMDTDKVDKFRARLKLRGEVFRIQILLAEKPAPVVVESKEQSDGKP